MLIKLNQIRTNEKKLLLRKFCSSVAIKLTVLTFSVQCHTECFRMFYVRWTKNITWIETVSIRQRYKKLATESDRENSIESCDRIHMRSVLCTAHTITQLTRLIHERSVENQIHTCCVRDNRWLFSMCVWWNLCVCVCAASWENVPKWRLRLGLDTTFKHISGVFQSVCWT